MTTYSTGRIGRSYYLEAALIDFTNVTLVRHCVRCLKPCGRQVVPIAAPTLTCPSCGHRWRARPRAEEFRESCRPRYFYVPFNSPAGQRTCSELAQAIAATSLPELPASNLVRNCRNLAAPGELLGPPLNREVLPS